jgi:TRAP-type C4-dicarboxylate transport system substrate-binding protein
MHKGPGHSFGSLFSTRRLCGVLISLVFLCMGGLRAQTQPQTQPQAQSQAQPQSRSIGFVGSPAESLAFRALEQPFVNRLLADEVLGLQKIELRPANPADSNSRELFERTVSGKSGLAVLGAAQLPLGEAWFDLADLTGLALDVPSARIVADAYRERTRTLLQEKFGLRLLALAGVQAQALYCRNEFKRLADLKGRKVRVAAGQQAALIESLGGTASRIPLGEVRAALAARTIDCAIGGTMSGNQARWHEVSSHLFSMPIAWDLGHYVIAEQSWMALTPATRQRLQTEFRNFESKVWDSALVYTREGINCNAGVEPCRNGQPGKMSIVIGIEADRAVLLKSMNEIVLPAWSARCGGACSTAFNQALAKLVGMKSIK